jgi:hypothetical protein
MVTVAGAAIRRSVDWRSFRRSDLEFLRAGAEVADSLTRSASVTGPVNLVVDVPIGNITVKAGGSNHVELQAIKRAWGWNHSQAEAVLDAITVGFEASGDHIRINAGGLKAVEDVPRSPQVDVALSVPEETTVQLVTNVGRILVSGTRGDVYVKADVGQIVLQDVAPTTTLQVEAISRHRSRWSPGQRAIPVNQR